MKSCKYHDYRVINGVIFILLVVLGLYLFAHHIVPLLEHTPGRTEDNVITPATCIEKGVKEVIVYCSKCDAEMSRYTEEIEFVECVAGRTEEENKKDSSCSKTGSYDLVKYCKVCDKEVSRELQTIETKPHTPADPKDGLGKLPTHTQDGYKYCLECNQTLYKEKVSATGHSYNWELKCSESGEFTMVGKCDCKEYNNTITLSKGLVVVRDESYSPCCRNIMIGTVTYNGQTITRSIELDPDSHKIIAVDVEDLDGNLTIGYISLDYFAKYNEYGEYYDLGDEEIAKYISYDVNSEWSYYGFNIGYFSCVRCSNEKCEECCDENGRTWFAIRIYSAEHDQRIAAN